MHRAAREGHDLVLELLIEKCGGDVNAREEDGTSTVTVLMAAAARGRTACVARCVRIHTGPHTTAIAW
jgi:ankyrin repeat protein